MSYRVEISRQAEMDIRTIYAYIREHGPANPSARCARPEMHLGLTVVATDVSGIFS